MRGSDRPRITGDAGDENSRPESLLKVNSFLKRFLDIKSLKVTGRDVERTTIEKSLINISNKVDDIAKIFTKKKEVDKKDRVIEKNEEKENDANDEKQRKVAEKKERRDRERDSEKPKKSGSIRLPEPKTGILDAIKKFLSNVITGFLLIKLATLTPLFQTISRLIVPVGKFFYEVGKKLLDGLVSFIDFGYKAYDFARGTIKNLFGEGAVKHFDKFSSTLNTFLNLAIITAITAASSFHKHQGEVGIKGTGPGRSRYGAEAGTARRYMRRFGRTAALRKFGTDAVRSLGPEATVRNQIKRTVTTSTRNFAQGTSTRLMNTGAAQAVKNSGIANAARALIPRAAVIPIIGGVLEFGLSLLAGDPIGKAAFRGIGAGLGTWIGGALGTLIPVPGVGTAIGMFLGSQGGATLAGMLYDGVFGKKTKVNTKTKARSRGGEVGDDTPELSKKYYPVNLSRPTSDRFESTEHIGNDLMDVEYFGPILASTSRLFAEGNKRLISKEYDNIGKGLMLMFRDYNLVSDEKLFELYRDKTLQKIFETEFKKKHDVKNINPYGSKDPVYTRDYGDDNSGPPPGPGAAPPGPGAGANVGDDLFSTISGGEGGIDSYNTGTAGSQEGYTPPKPISQMTVGEIMDAQRGNLHAVGKYQIIPGTMKEFVKDTGISRNDVFNEETQDKFKEYTINYKRPSVGKFLTGAAGSSLEKAQLALAAEFASVGVPYDMKRGEYNGKYPLMNIKKGESLYKGKGDNAASISPEIIAKALRKEKEINLKPTSTPQTNGTYAILCYGTNDFSLSESQIKTNAAGMIRGLKSKGYTVIVVPPSPQLYINKSYKAPYNGVSAAAKAEGVHIERGVYAPEDQLGKYVHLEPIDAERIRNKYKPAIYVGDSNAVGIAGKVKQAKAKIKGKSIITAEDGAGGHKIQALINDITSTSPIPANLEKGGIISGKKAESASKNISRYASYEQGSESSVVVMVSNNNIVSAPSSNSPIAIPVQIGSSDSRDQELLDMIG